MRPEVPCPATAAAAARSRDGLPMGVSTDLCPASLHRPGPLGAKGGYREAPAWTLRPARGALQAPSRACWSFAERVSGRPGEEGNQDQIDPPARGHSGLDRHVREPTRYHTSAPASPLQTWRTILKAGRAPRGRGQQEKLLPDDRYFHAPGRYPRRGALAILADPTPAQGRCPRLA